MARFAVIGSGAWGTALACHLARLEHAVTMWAYEPEVIEERTLKLMSTVLEETMPGLEPERLAFLSGPTFAREVAQSLPTDVVVASKGMIAARKVQDLVHSLTLRTYTSADPIGVQVGGAVKNVMAIATAACDGLRVGMSARAA